MKTPCAFFDRDGVINRKAAPGEYINSWDEFELLTPVVDWIRIFNAIDYRVIVVTNQRGIARGITAPEAVADIHRRMVELLASQQATIDDVFVCPHQQDTCDCRKPAPGMIRAATSKWNLDLSRSIMIGDSDSDRELAANCNLTFLQVENGSIEHVISQ